MPLATEQRDSLIEGIDELFSRNYISIFEGVMLLFRAGIAVAVLVLSSRIIATPPPLGFDGFALILPAPVWSTFLLSTAALSFWGRMTQNLCIRRNGSAGGFFVMAALLGPLFLKAPGMCCVVFLLLVLQAIPAVHLKRQCAAVEKQASGGGN